jgi:ubiquinone/menaquinone biosynthesis C-methylase UbiE
MKNPLHYHIGVRYRTCLILKYLRPRLKKAHKILDVGCGLGYMLQRISNINKDVKCVGLDIEKEVLENAKHFDKRKKIKFVVGNCLSLPFKREFDHVICSEVIEHLQKPELFVKEAHKVLKDKGLFIITTPSIEGILKVSDICHEHGSEKHFREGFTKKELKKILNDNGFKVLKVRYSMVFFTQLIMELTKLGYSLKNKKYSKQSQLIKEKKSLIFTIYKKLFFIQLFFVKIDKFLEKLLKGSIIVVVAQKK